VWPEVYRQVEVEIAQLDQLLAAYHSLTTRSATTPPDFIELSALATMLHSFYTGVENIFKRIAVEIDNSLPGGAFWHSELLDLMMQPGSSRPSVISVDLRVRLKEYLNFRHVFRQSYSFNLHWEKMAHLVLECEDIWNELKIALDELFRPA
jgi:hypothetical protein